MMGGQFFSSERGQVLGLVTLCGRNLGVHLGTDSAQFDGALQAKQCCFPLFTAMAHLSTTQQFLAVNESSCGKVSGQFIHLSGQATWTLGSFWKDGSPA